MSFDKKEYKKQYRIRKKEELARKQKEYYQQNKEKASVYGKEYYKKNKESLLVKQKNTYYLSLYGITSIDYKELLEKQKGLCLICGKPERTRKNNCDSLRNLAVDHCHTTGRVRGLLCRACNTLIGLAEEDTNTLRSAVDYLEKHRGNK